jgi:hypothetical protein
VIPDTEHRDFAKNAQEVMKSVDERASDEVMK